MANSKQFQIHCLTWANLKLFMNLTPFPAVLLYIKTNRGRLERNAYLTNTPLIILAGKEYGSGSSRDWAAKGTFLLGVKAVLAESYERIHRSNLVGMGVLPLQYKAGETASSLGLTGNEMITITGIAEDIKPLKEVQVIAKKPDGSEVVFLAIARMDSNIEIEYYRHGGILQYVLRQFLDKAESDL